MVFCIKFVINLYYFCQYSIVAAKPRQSCGHCPQEHGNKQLRNWFLLQGSQLLCHRGRMICRLQEPPTSNQRCGSVAVCRTLDCQILDLPCTDKYPIFLEKRIWHPSVRGKNRVVRALCMKMKKTRSTVF